MGKELCQTCTSLQRCFYDGQSIIGLQQAKEYGNVANCPQFPALFENALSSAENFFSETTIIDPSEQEQLHTVEVAVPSTVSSEISANDEVIELQSPDTPEINALLYKRVIAKETALRFWGHQIEPYLKADHWPISPVADVVLAEIFTFYHTPAQVVEQLSTDGVTITEDEVKHLLCGSLLHLIDDFIPVLQAREQQKELMSQLIENMDAVRSFLQLIQTAETQQLEDREIEIIMQHNIVRLLVHKYLDIRTKLWATNNPEFLPSNEVAISARFSDYHIRYLARIGEIEGVRTDQGWVVYSPSVDDYRTRPTKPGQGRPRKRL